MPNNATVPVQDLSTTDPRIARTTQALGGALVALIQEREFTDITVQHILDRAGVGRATFYAHYRNKDDALHSSYESVFAAFEAMLDRPSAAGPRLFPVAEFMVHIADMRPFVDALHRAGRLEEAWALFAGQTARIIERRFVSWTGRPLATPGALAARMLAGALVESVKWWQDHPEAASPAQMDVAFHALARGALQRPL
jgi:AcrR family transcriptional regulator